MDVRTRIHMMTNRHRIKGGEVLCERQRTARIRLYEIHPLSTHTHWQWGRAPSGNLSVCGLMMDFASVSPRPKGPRAPPVPPDYGSLVGQITVILPRTGCL